MLNFAQDFKLRMEVLVAMRSEKIPQPLGKDRNVYERNGKKIVVFWTVKEHCDLRVAEFDMESLLSVDYLELLSKIYILLHKIHLAHVKSRVGEHLMRRILT